MITHERFEELVVKHAESANRTDMSGLSTDDIDSILEYTTQMAARCNRTRRFLGRMASVEEGDATTLFDMQERFRIYAIILKKAVNRE